MTEYISGLEIGKQIGEGNFGQVFRGTDPAHGDVAVKVLSRKEQHDDKKWDLYKGGALNEAQHLAKAKHRNVVQVFHVVEGDGGDSVVICMEFCAGGSLQAAVEKGPMDLGTTRKVATDVLLGLGALHSRNMLHRDIKPANILVDGAGTVKISDFGLVTDDLILGYGSQAGYFDHVAYEVWHGAGTSPRTDIWALGMTLYRLLHGEDWYNETPKPKFLIRDGGYADTLNWLPHVPKSWRTVIRKMLNDDPAKRYQSAGAALSGIARLPIQPSWETKVSKDVVTWERTNKARKICVEWERISERKHRWRAWSEPVTSGRTRTLAGSEGIVGKNATLEGLRNFFEA